MVIKTGWEEPLLPQEETGNIIGIDFSMLDADEAAYLDAVRDHLSLPPAVMRSLPRKAWKR